MFRKILMLLIAVAALVNYSYVIGEVGYPYSYCEKQVFDQYDNLLTWHQVWDIVCICNAGGYYCDGGS